MDADPFDTDFTDSRGFLFVCFECFVGTFPSVVGWPAISTGWSALEILE